MMKPPAGPDVILFAASSSRAISAANRPAYSSRSEASSLSGAIAYAPPISAGESMQASLISLVIGPKPMHQGGNQPSIA